MFISFLLLLKVSLSPSLPPPPIKCVQYWYSYTCCGSLWTPTPPHLLSVCSTGIHTPAADPYGPLTVVLEVVCAIKCSIFQRFHNSASSFTSKSPEKTHKILHILAKFASGNLICEKFLALRCDKTIQDRERIFAVSFLCYTVEDHVTVA